MRATGLCGSDLHYYNHGRNGDIILQEPLSLGHESAGEVVAIGLDVEGYEVGDLVAIECGIPCGSCGHCNIGRYNICTTLRFRSSAKSIPHFQGTLQERLNHPAKWCHKLHPDMSPFLGVILEPMSVAMNAIKRACLSQHENATVLVFGAGTVGLLCAYIAKQLGGASKVIIADIDQGRLNFAIEKAFADQAFLVPQRHGQTVQEKLTIAKDTANNIMDLQGNFPDNARRAVDIVFECTGVESCVQASIYLTKPGGRIMLVGMGTPIQTLPISAAALHEVDLCGVFRYANTYPGGIALLHDMTGQLPDLQSLITHRFQGLEHASEAFEMAAKTVDGDGKLILKVVIEMGKSSGITFFGV